MESILNELKQLMEQYSEGLVTETEMGYKIVEILEGARSADLIKIIAEALKSDELL